MFCRYSITGEGEKYPCAGFPAIWDPSCSHEATLLTTLSPPEQHSCQMLCPGMCKWGITLGGESVVHINLSTLFSLAVCPAKIKGKARLFMKRGCTSWLLSSIICTPGSASPGFSRTQNWGSDGKDDVKDWTPGRPVFFKLLCSPGISTSFGMNSKD